MSDPAQRVVFGTSGHRGSSFDGAFNETHIAATTQAIVDYRTAQGISGPLFVGRDTHGLSRPAETTALEVLEANGVHALVDEFDDYVPTPALSRAIISHNRALAGLDRLDHRSATPTASSSRRPTTRRATAASSTTRRTAARPTPTPRGGSRTAPTSSSRATCGR